MNDIYSKDINKFDFADYVAAAYEQLAVREDRKIDGDLSHALSLLMAWDSVVRGLIHWDSLKPRPSLGTASALPLAADRVPWKRIKMRRWLRRHYSFHFLVRRFREKFHGIFSKRKKS